MTRVVHRSTHAVMDLAVRCVARLSRRWGDHRQSTGHVIVVAPGGPGSVGDAAMLGGLIAGLRARGARKVLLLNTDDREWGAEVDADIQINASGVLAWFGRRQLLSLVPRLWTCYALYVIGADIIDGVYSVPAAVSRVRLLDLATRFGCKAVLTGSSMGERPAAEVIALMRSLPGNVILCAREPVTKERMERTLGREVTLTADCAFLPMKEAEVDRDAALRAWIEACRDEGRVIVAVNVNALQVAKLPDLPAALQSCLGDLARKRKLAVLLIPHDTRGPSSDVVLAERMEVALASTVEKVMSLSAPLTPNRIRNVVAHVDLVVTGRMHLAILSLGQNVPPLSIVYHGKFEGLYRLFGLPGGELTIQPQDIVRNPEAFVDMVGHALDAREKYRATIAERLMEVKRLAQNNLAA